MEFFIIPTGVVLIALAFIELVKAVLYLRNSEKKEGEIISIRKVSESNGGTALKTEYPNVTYLDDYFQRKTFTSTFGFMPGKHRTGDQVFIRYYRNDIRIDHWFPLWGRVIFMFGAGIVFSCFGMLFHFGG